MSRFDVSCCSQISCMSCVASIYLKSFPSHLRRSRIKPLHLRQRCVAFSMLCGDAEMEPEFFKMCQFAHISLISSEYASGVQVKLWSFLTQGPTAKTKS